MKEEGSEEGERREAEGERRSEGREKVKGDVEEGRSEDRKRKGEVE